MVLWLESGFVLVLGSGLGRHVNTNVHAAFNILRQSQSLILNLLVRVRVRIRVGSGGFEFVTLSALNEGHWVGFCRPIYMLVLVLAYFRAAALGLLLSPELLEFAHQLLLQPPWICIIYWGKGQWKHTHTHTHTHTHMHTHIHTPYHPYTHTHTSIHIDNFHQQPLRLLYGRETSIISISNGSMRNYHPRIYRQA